jgi:hypothetical protein
MRCAACNTENPDDGGHCRTCGNTSAPRRKASGRRRTALDEVESPFSPNIDPVNRTAAWAWRLSVFGLIPGAGLLLGPLALLLGVVARRRGKRDPAFTANHLAAAAIILGGLLTITTWLGLALMLLGLRPPH